MWIRRVFHVNCFRILNFHDFKIMIHLKTNFDYNERQWIEKGTVWREWNGGKFYVQHSENFYYKSFVKCLAFFGNWNNFQCFGHDFNGPINFLRKKHENQEFSLVARSRFRLAQICYRWTCWRWIAVGKKVASSHPLNTSIFQNSQRALYWR